MQREDCASRMSSPQLNQFALVRSPLLYWAYIVCAPTPWARVEGTRTKSRRRVERPVVGEREIPPRSLLLHPVGLASQIESRARTCGRTLFTKTAQLSLKSIGKVISLVWKFLKCKSCLRHPRPVLNKSNVRLSGESGEQESLCKVWTVGVQATQFVEFDPKDKMRCVVNNNP